MERILTIRTGINIMKSKTNGHLSYRSLLLFLACVLIITVYDNFLMTTYVDKSLGTAFNAFIVLLSLAYFAFDTIRKKTISNSIIVCFIVIFLLFVSTIINESNYFATATKSGLFLFAIVFSQNHSLEEFTKKNKQIMFVISLYTLIINLLFFVGLDFSFMPALSNTKGTIFYWGILGNIHANSSTQMPRLSGIWWEPGVYAAYLVSSLILELFVSKKKSPLYICLLIASLALTFSTSGYFAFAILIFAYALSLGQKKKYFAFLVILLFLIAIVAFAFTNDFLRDILFTKLIERDESFKDRFYSIYGNILAFSKSPLLGLGTIKSSEIIQNYMIANGSIRSFSNLNTPLAYFSVFGLVPGLYFNSKVIGFSNNCGKSVVQKILIFVTILIILMSTNYLFSLYFTVLFFLRKNKTLHEKK